MPIGFTILKMATVLARTFGSSLKQSHSVSDLNNLWNLEGCFVPKHNGMGNYAHDELYLTTKQKLLKTFESLANCTLVTYNIFALKWME